MDMLSRDDAIRQLVATYDALKSEKSQRNSYWQELLEATIPHKAAVTSDFTMSSKPFRGRYDAMGMLGQARFASGMQTHGMPPQSTNFLLTPAAGSRQAGDRRYEQNLADRAERLHQAIWASNFDTEIYGSFEDLASGTCCIAAARDKEQPFTLSTRPIAEYCFLEDHTGKPDTVFLERGWTAYQAATRFGAAKLDEPVRKLLSEMSSEAYTQKKPYLNVVRPNQQWDPAALTSGRWPFQSLWIEKETKRVLEETGYRRQRYIVSRFWRPTGMLWGMGPSDMAYSWVRCKNKLMEIVLKYAAKVMDPPSVWPDDGAFHPKTTAPGAIIKGRLSAIGGGVPQYLQLQGNHLLTQFLFDHCDALIMQCYFADIFRLLTDDKTRTAAEVATVLQKDFSLAVPVMGRLRNELFAPLIRLLLELLTEYELGIYGWKYGGKDLPEEPLNLELISPLGLAVKYQELQKMSDLIRLNSPLAQMDPHVWENYSLDEMSRAIGENMGAPRRWLRSITERRAIREASAALLAQREALEQAKLAADATNKMSKAVEPNSPMAAMAAA